MSQGLRIVRISPTRWGCCLYFGLAVCSLGGTNVGAYSNPYKIPLMRFPLPLESSKWLRCDQGSFDVSRYLRELIELDSKFDGTMIKRTCYVSFEDRVENCHSFCTFCLVFFLHAISSSHSAPY